MSTGVGWRILVWVLAWTVVWSPVTGAEEVEVPTHAGLQDYAPECPETPSPDLSPAQPVSPEPEGVQPSQPEQSRPEKSLTESGEAQEDCEPAEAEVAAQDSTADDYGMLCGEMFPLDGEAIELPEPEGWIAWLDAPHDYLSGGVETMAAGIDRFFAGEKTYTYSTRSYVRVQNDTYWEERQHAQTKLRLKAKLDLPLTKKKLKLLVESDPEELQTPQEQVLEANPVASTRSNDLFVSVEKEKPPRQGWQVRPSLGLKIRSPLELFARLRISNKYFPGEWEVRPQQTFYWFDRRGYGSDTVLEMDRPLSERLLFRASSLLRWTEETDYFTASEVFSLFQTLSDNRKISYQVGVYGNEVPGWHTTQYLLSLTYRQRIHSNWLFMEIRPQVSYDKVRDWDSTNSLLFRIEAVFGRSYMRK